MDQFFLPFEAPLVDIRKKIDELRSFSSSQAIDLKKEIKDLEEEHEKKTEEIFSSLTDWNRVQLSRHQLRPTFNLYKDECFDEFVELYGDRHFGNDPAIRCGLAKIGDLKFLVVGHFRGEDTEEKIACHFGYAHPEGYRKALSKFKLAEKFGLPIVCLVNTPGAYPGRGAEERNQSEALAMNIMEMTHLKVPIYCVIMSEGGSGGALGIGVGDRLDIFEYAYLSVISPEGCAAILWKDSTKAEEAASALKCTTPHLKKFGLVDQVLKEPFGGAHRDPNAAAQTLKESIVSRLTELCAKDIDELLKERDQRIRSLGSFIDSQMEAAQKENA